MIRNAGKTKGEKLGIEAAKIEVLRRRIRKEQDTLFFIIHDEAHFAPIRHNLTDKLINGEEIISAKNVVLLQVSATPYCLLTTNSRFEVLSCSNSIMTNSSGFPRKTRWTWPWRWRRSLESPLTTGLASLSSGQSSRKNQHRFFSRRDRDKVRARHVDGGQGLRRAHGFLVRMGDVREGSLSTRGKEARD